MSKPLNILLVEDSEDDSLLLIRELRRGGYDPVYERIETSEAMRSALGRQPWDIVISDYILPKFSGLAALTILKESKQDIPFVIVSGNIGEDIAVNAMRAGAHDYIIKGNLTRLIPAVERELRESEIRRERMNAEEQLKKSRQRLFETLETIREGFFLLDRDWRFTYANTEAARLWKKSRGELIGNIIWDVTPDAVGSLFDEQYHKAVKEQVPVMFESLSPQLGIWIEVRAYPSADGLAVYFHDITGRKQAEEKIAGLTRFYLVLANVNEAIVRRKEQQTLFDEVCSIIVETGGFRLAWVGLVDPVSSEVRPVSSAGANKYLDGIRIVAADVPEGRGPTGRAIREARHIIITDVEADEAMKPWLVRARANGIRSSSAFPLRVGDEVIGALTIYSDQPSFFTIEEVTLFLALSENISFALETMKNEQARLKTVEKIRRSESEIRDLYNNAPCGYHSLDKDGTIVRINDTELRWLDYSRDDVVGKKKIYDFYTPEGVSRFNQTYPKFVENGSTAELELDLVRKDGTTFPVLLSGTAIRDRNGNFVMSRSTMFDMTERKEVERRTQTTNSLLKLFTQKFSRKVYLGAVCKLLQDWSGCRNVGIRIVNPADSIPFEACIGYDKVFLKQESGLSLSTDRCICPRIVAGNPEPSDLKSMTPSGSFYSNDSLQFESGLSDTERSWYRGVCMKLGFKSLAVIPIKYRDKSVGSLHLSDERSDMFTDQKVEFLEQLAYIIGEAVFRFGIEEEQMRLASAVMSAADAVVITEPAAGMIQYVNPAFEQITGYRREEVFGRSLHLLDSGKHDEAFFREVRDVIKRDGVWQGRLYNKKKDGTIYLEDCTCSPVKDQSGMIINFVFVKRDVTDKVRLESIAESVNTMNNIGYIFSGVRHEIGNPINSAKMILSVLQYKLEKASKEMIKENIDRTLVEIGRVEHLLKNLKNFNLYEKPELQNVNMVKYLQEFMKLISEDFGAKGISVTHEVAPDAEWSYVDPRALQQVLMNLMTNSADAVKGRNNPAISIAVRKEGGLILLTVVDDGVGMTEKQLDDLFKPFYTSKPHGTGLGLVIVKKMLAKMNCDIVVTSVLHEGTMVVISIPEGSDGKQQQKNALDN